MTPGSDIKADIRPAADRGGKTSTKDVTFGRHAPPRSTAATWRLLVAFLVLGCTALSADRSQAQSRNDAIDRLRHCLEDISAVADRCGGKPLEAVVDRYLAGDTTLLAHILRAYPLKMSGTDTNPGAIYLQLFLRDPSAFLAASRRLRARERAGAFEAFAEASAQISAGDLEAIQVALAARRNTNDAATSTELLREVEIDNAYRLRAYFPPDVFTRKDVTVSVTSSDDGIRVNCSRSTNLRCIPWFCPSRPWSTDSCGSEVSTNR